MTGRGRFQGQGRRRIATWLAGGLLAGVVALALVGPYVTPYDPIKQAVRHQFEGPSPRHLLGTDYLGRDTLSRLMAGTRLSVTGAVETLAGGFLLGVPLGLASAFVGRRGQFVLLRLVESLLTIPFVLFAIAVTAVAGSNLHAAMFAVGVLFTPRFFRITRAATVELASAQYVEVSTLLGASRLWVIRRHVWRKVLPTVAVTAATTLASAFMLSASLTYIGLGVVPPTPTWGGMIATEQDYLARRPWAPFVPALAIVLTVLAINLLADGLRDRVGPAAGSAPEPEPGSGTAPGPDEVVEQPVAEADDGKEVGDVVGVR